MSKNTKQDPKDLIEDITVEELRSDGLVEDVDVEGEAKKKQETDNTPTGKPTGSDEVKSAIAAAPVAEG